MPEGHFVLAELPAEQDLLVAAPGRKVDETLVQVLDEHAERVELLDAVRDLGRLALDRRSELVDLVRPDTTAVAGDLGGDASVADGRDGEQPAVGDHLLRKRAHLRQELVCLFGREIAFGHRLYVPPKWAGSRTWTPSRST